MPAKEPAVEGEWLGPQGSHVAPERVRWHAATVHRMDPGRREPLNAINNTQYGVSAAEYAECSVEFAHVRSQILSNDAGLIEDSSEDAAAMTARSDIMMTAEDTVAHGT